MPVLQEQKPAQANWSVPGHNFPVSVPKLLCFYSDPIYLTFFLLVEKEC